MDIGLQAQPLLWVRHLSFHAPQLPSAGVDGAAAQNSHQACVQEAWPHPPVWLGVGVPTQHGLPQAQRTGLSRRRPSHLALRSWWGKGVPPLSSDQVGLGPLQHLSAEPPKTTIKVAIVRLAIWDYFIQLCFPASLSLLSPHHFLWKVSQIPILTKV